MVFPERFDDIEHARAHCRPFFHWYNHEHRHFLRRDVDEPLRVQHVKHLLALGLVSARSGVGRGLAGRGCGGRRRR